MKYFGCCLQPLLCQPTEHDFALSWLFSVPAIRTAQYKFTYLLTQLLQLCAFVKRILFCMLVTQMVAVDSCNAMRIELRWCILRLTFEINESVAHCAALRSSSDYWKTVWQCCTIKPAYDTYSGYTNVLPTSYMYNTHAAQLIKQCYKLSCPALLEQLHVKLTCMCRIVTVRQWYFFR